MGLEPTRYCYHKILSLARLPVPTLPHIRSFSAPNKSRFFIIDSNYQSLFLFFANGAGECHATQNFPPPPPWDVPEEETCTLEPPEWLSLGCGLAVLSRFAYKKISLLSVRCILSLRT